MTANLSTKADSTENSPLVAAYAGSMDFLVPFLKAGGPPSYSNSAGDTLLHAAADGWQHCMIEFLILAGADPNAQNEHGDTPLHSVTRSRTVPAEGTFIRSPDPQEARSRTFQELLLRRADRSIKNTQGANCLHLAAWEGDLLAINILSEAGTINDLTSKGATPLVLAILNEHVECARRLLAFGASPNIELPGGKRPVDYIRSSKNPAVRAFIDEIPDQRD